MVSLPTTKAERPNYVVVNAVTGSKTPAIAAVGGPELVLKFFEEFSNSPNAVEEVSAWMDEASPGDALLIPQNPAKSVADAADDHYAGIVVFRVTTCLSLSRRMHVRALLDGSFESGRKIL